MSCGVKVQLVPYIVPGISFAIFPLWPYAQPNIFLALPSVTCLYVILLGICFHMPVWGTSVFGVVSLL